jgi:hypothetical protein
MIKWQHFCVEEAQNNCINVAICYNVANQLQMKNPTSSIGGRRMTPFGLPARKGFDI